MKTRKLTCFCGETTMETSMVGTPPSCVGCNECHSTLAESKSKCEQMTLHEWEKTGESEHVCKKCMARVYKSEK